MLVQLCKKEDILGDIFWKVKVDGIVEKSFLNDENAGRMCYLGVLRRIDQGYPKKK